MQYAYTVTDLQTGKVYNFVTAPNEYASYMEFIGELYALNSLYDGELLYQEFRPETHLTKQLQAV